MAVKRRSQMEEFAAGYQGALADIVRELSEGGLPAVVTWINNNALSTSIRSDLATWQRSQATDES